MVSLTDVLCYWIEKLGEVWHQLVRHQATVCGQGVGATQELGQLLEVKWATGGVKEVLKRRQPGGGQQDGCALAVHGQEGGELEVTDEESQKPVFLPSIPQQPAIYARRQ